MPKEIENKIDEDSSSIVKSTGSAIVKTPERPLPNLVPVDQETEESTSITTEQLQSIRNGLETTVKLTDQIVKVIGDGNKSFNKDITKIGNLRRRLRDNNSKIRDITGKKGIMGGMMGSIGGTAKKAGTPLLGAALLEFLATILENPGKATRGAMLGLPTAGKEVAKPISQLKKNNRIKDMRKVIKKRNVKIKSNTLKGKGIKPEVKVKGAKITGGQPAKAPSIAKSLGSQTAKKTSKGLLRRLGRGNVAVSTIFAAWEFADRKKEGQTNLQAAVGTGGGLAGGLAGAAAGAKIGAVLGSFFGPGPGTVIGGVIGGLAGGVIGSFAGGGLADKVTGVDKNKDNIEAKNEPNKNVKGIKKNSGLDVLNKDTSQKNIEIHIIDSDQDFELNP